MHLLAIIVFIVVSGLAWRLGHGPQGVAYLLGMALACVPGLPLGTALFGRHVAGWVTGAALGYAISCTTLWAAIELGASSPIALAIAFALVSILTWAAAWGRGPLLPVRPWTGAEARALCLLLLLVPAIVGPPFDNNGARDEGGNRYFRAYFTADFMWHMALTKELARLRLPPRNPYEARSRLQYYWTYFLVPAVVVAHAPPETLNTERVLELNALGTGLLFVATLFVTTWLVVPIGWAAALGVAATFVAASAEGAFLIWRVFSRAEALSWVRGVNVDAVTLWVFSGLTIDGLPRALWYTPQHAFSCTLALPALVLAGSAVRPTAFGALLPCDGGPPTTAVWIAGLCLAGSVVFSPFLGMVFTVAYGLIALAAALRAGRAGLVLLTRLALAAVPVLVAAAACSASEMINSGGAALTIGLAVLARNSPLTTLFLSVGPVLVPALVGLLLIRRLPVELWGAVLVLLLGIGIFFFVSLGYTDPIWVGWRGGQVVLIALPPLVASFFAQCYRRGGRVVAWAAALVLFIVGAPTTVLDAYNAQDTSNRDDTTYYRWTVHFTADQQEAFRWIAVHTPADAVVQMEPISRRRDLWSVIPSLAGRRMAAGLPIWILDMPETEARAEEISRVFRTDDVAEAWELAWRRGLDFIYIDRFDRESLPEPALRKFDIAPERFQLAFRNRDVSLYRVVKAGA